MGEFTSTVTVHNEEQQTTNVSPSSQNNLLQVQEPEPEEEIPPSSTQDLSTANLHKFHTTESIYTNNISCPMKQIEERKSGSADPTESGLKFRLVQPLCNSGIATLSELTPSVFAQAQDKPSDISNNSQSDPLKIQLCQPLVGASTSLSRSDFASHVVIPVREPAVASLFADLWNGHPITLPTHAWAIHKIQKNGIGPLVVINEMMANDQGVPFVLKQLVINSYGNMMAVVLNHVIDVSILSVLPLRTVEELQKALIYFDQIDCEYAYLEQTGG